MLSINKRTIVVSLVAIALIFVAALAYVLLQPATPVGSDSVIATPAPEVKKQLVKEVRIKAPVKIYAGNTKANLKLPAAVIADESMQVMAASQVRRSERPQTVSTVVNTTTGEVQSYVKEEPYPWLAVDTRGEIRAAYGYKYSAASHSVEKVGRLMATYDVLRVKALTVGVVGSFDTDKDAFVGVGVAYRW